MCRVPSATYRLQFNATFTFDDARWVVPYLAELGISDLYASPILRARRGSGHGYDVVDPASLNPELGSDEAFDDLDAELKRHRLGLLLDVVPNHMAASPENVWWMSVLENGQRSRFLHYFDIDWSPLTAHGQTVMRVLLPILGRPYGDTVEAGEIVLGFDQDGFFFQYYEHRLPLAPESYRIVVEPCIETLEGATAAEIREVVGGEEVVANSRFLKETLWRLYQSDADFRAALEKTITAFNGRPGEPESFNALDRLLDAQWYRLAWWRMASEKINYRRFFDVTDLVGVRVENAEVFEARNRRTLELIAAGKVTGLRIDHIDGLHDPIGHMEKLQRRLAEDGGRTSEPDGPSPFFIVVEKVLARGEKLATEFPASGTTGYDFLGAANELFIDGEGLARLTDFYRAFTGETREWRDIVRERKAQVIAGLFPGEMRSLGNLLGSLAMLDRSARDFPPSELLAALTEVTTCMPVYRTYIRDFDVRDDDRRTIEAAVAEARERAAGEIDERLFTLLHDRLLLRIPPHADESRAGWLDFVMRWQQFTGRVMAKGVEDTAFYNYNRLLSLNEVGGDPGLDPSTDTVEAFHAHNARIARDWPATLNATSTHDTKRSEDVRARLNVLSELAPAWAREVRRWSAMNAPLREGGIPDRNVELHIYQTLAGFWPLASADSASVAGRLDAYLEKAAREAKTHTSWIAPDAAYEASLRRFAAGILANAEFVASFLRFQKRLAFRGALNSLAQTVLKITSPGIPDFYQGSELWDFSLVDPDNRRPVDYASRHSMLEAISSANAAGKLLTSRLLRSWSDGRIKMFVTWRALDVRKRHAATFERGSYVPLRGGGKHVCAFLRGESVLVAVPRLTSQLGRGIPIGEVWREADLEVGGRWVNAFTGERVEGTRLRDVFARLPFAILERAD